MFWIVNIFAVWTMVVSRRGWRLFEAALSCPLNPQTGWDGTHMESFWGFVLTMMSSYNVKQDSSWPASRRTTWQQRFFYYTSSLCFLLSSFPRDLNHFQHSFTAAVQCCVYLRARRMGVLVWNMWERTGTLKVMIRCVKWNSASRSSWVVTFSTPVRYKRKITQEINC